MTVIDDMPVRDLTTEQLATALGCRRAIENAEPPPPLEWETLERTTEEQLYRFAQWARELGADEGLIGCELYATLLDHGYGQADALEALRDVGIVWQPQPIEERLVHVAAGMLETGWTEAEVTWAIDGLVSGGR